jgi:hypothetical protein
MRGSVPDASMITGPCHGGMFSSLRRAPEDARQTSLPRMRPRCSVSTSIETSGIDLVLFIVQNRTFGPYLAAIAMTLYSVMAWGLRVKCLCWTNRNKSPTS